MPITGPRLASKLCDVTNCARSPASWYQIFSEHGENVSFDRWAVKTTFCRQTYAHTLFSTANSDVQLLEEEEEEISDWKETLSWLSLTTLFLDLRQRYVDPRDWG